MHYPYKYGAAATQVCCHKHDAEHVDVEARLQQMTYQGAGYSSIHQTQLDCTGAMLDRGTAVHDIVEAIFNRTVTAAGVYAKNWNWEEEHRKLRDMCDDHIVARQRKFATAAAMAAAALYEPKQFEVRP